MFESSKNFFDFFTQFQVKFVRTEKNFNYKIIGDYQPKFFFHAE